MLTRANKANALTCRLMDVLQLGLRAVRVWLSQPILAPVPASLLELIRGQAKGKRHGGRGLNFSLD